MIEKLTELKEMEFNEWKLNNESLAKEKEYMESDLNDYKLKVMETCNN